MQRPVQATGEAFILVPIQVGTPIRKDRHHSLDFLPLGSHIVWKSVLVLFTDFLPLGSPHSLYLTGTLQETPTGNPVPRMVIPSQELQKIGIKKRYQRKLEWSIPMFYVLHLEKRI